MKTKGAILLLAAVGGIMALTLSAQNDPSSARTPQIYTTAPKTISGRVRQSAEMKELSLIGLKLGMPLDEAEQALKSLGFTQRRAPSPITDTSGENLKYFGDYQGEQPVETPNHDGEDGPGDSRQVVHIPMLRNVVNLGYVKSGNGPATLAKISYFAPVTTAELKNAEGKRAELIHKYGQPTWWKQDTADHGYILDNMSYATSKELADEARFQGISACLSDWKQERLCNKVDCRKVLASAQGAVMRVSFMGWEHYQLEDVTAQRASLMRDSHFAAQATGNAKCMPPPME